MKRTAHAVLFFAADNCTSVQHDPRRRKKLPLPERHPLARPRQRHEVWGLAFVFDEPANGRLRPWWCRCAARIFGSLQHHRRAQRVAHPVQCFDVRRGGAHSRELLAQAGDAHFQCGG